MNYLNSCLILTCRCLYFQVQDLFESIQEVREKEHKTQSLPDSLQIENMSSQLFEVMYIGKITVSDTKAPPSFIDDAVSKFVEHERRKRTHLDRNTEPNTEHIQSGEDSREDSGISCEADNSSESLNDRNVSDQDSANESSPHESGKVQKPSASDCDDTMLKRPSVDSTTSMNSVFSGNEVDEENNNVHKSDKDGLENAHADKIGCKGKKVSHGTLSSVNENFINLGQTGDKSDMALADETVRNQDVSRREEKGNRTMLIQVGSTSVALISPDRKSVILERRFKDISFCSQVSMIVCLVFA